MQLSPYEVKALAASQDAHGNKIITLLARYPRFIHAEVMTHKKQVRNASSSRAVPVKTFLASIVSDPARPMHWGVNRPGMTASEELEGWRREAVKALWNMHMRYSVWTANVMNKLGGHKQFVNRLLEPHMFITTQITVEVEELKRICGLRIEFAAQPEIQELYSNMLYVAQNTYYQILNEDDWHLPWIRCDERRHPSKDQLIFVSAARSGRLSFKPHGDVPPEWRKDIRRADNLWDQMHLSPFEHQVRLRNADDGVGPFKHFTNYRTHKGF